MNMEKVYTIFEPVTVGWGDQTKIIPADRVMGVIRRIEKHITMKELVVMQQSRDTIPLAVVSDAYAEVLNYAGFASITADEVYQSLFSRHEATERIMMAVLTLMNLMLPPPTVKAFNGGELKTGKSPPVVAKSSRKRTKQRSAGA